jgi:hypothetical protein
MALSTKNIPNQPARFAKTIEPGNKMAKINDITLQESRFEDGRAKGELDLILHVEGVDLGDDFVGFMIDKDDQSKGTYNGQIGRVRATPFPFADATLPSGKVVNRDLSILAFIKDLAKELGKMEAIDSIEADTIEEYVPKAAEALKGNTFLNFCFAGREYEKGGYTNYDLYLPRFNKGRKPFENADAEPSKVIQFIEAEHIRKKKAATSVDSFAPVSSEFDMN